MRRCTLFLRNIRRIFHLSLRLVTFGGRSSHLALCTKVAVLKTATFRFILFRTPKREGDDLNVRWTPTRPGTVDYLHMDSTVDELRTRMSVRFKCNEVALWNSLVPDLAATCRHCRAPQNCDVSKTWMFFGLTICLLCVVIILLCAIVWSHKNGKNYGLLRRNSSSLRTQPYGLVM